MNIETDLLPIFSADVENANTEILIVSPFMRKSRMSQMVKLLAPKLVNGIYITVVTRPPEDFKDSEQGTVIQCADMLKGCGVNVR